MAYEPSTVIGRCASSAHGQNWESVTADWKMPIIERRIKNMVQLSRLAQIFLAKLGGDTLLLMSAGLVL